MAAAGISYELIDGNAEAYRLITPEKWLRRKDFQYLHQSKNLPWDKIRYKQAIGNYNVRLNAAVSSRFIVTPANYTDHQLTPLKFEDLQTSKIRFQENLFFPWIEQRILPYLEKSIVPTFGLSVNYLSQALTAMAIIGFIKSVKPESRIILGGGLVTSWVKNFQGSVQFNDLADEIIPGPGESILPELLGSSSNPQQCSTALPDYSSFTQLSYTAPKFILPYSASYGCSWKKCRFCPEKAENNPFDQLMPDTAVHQLQQLVKLHSPGLIHITDNEITPALMTRLAKTELGALWYGYSRFFPALKNPDFCKELRRSGCIMLQLGLESGNQDVLNRMGKGIQLDDVSIILNNLKEAGIGTYIYLLFGTPMETESAAFDTANFIVKHREAIDFMNLAIFNLPINSGLIKDVKTKDFYDGDLSLYKDFHHPSGWDRGKVRVFLSREFKKHPDISPIVKATPPIFTSNHAPFFLT